MRTTAADRPSRTPRLCMSGVTSLLALVVAGALTGCSSSSASSTTAPTAATTACNRPLPSTAVAATPAAGSTTDWSVTSFDGTVIRAHWFPVEAQNASPGSGGLPGPHPTVLMGPGWSLPGDTDTSGQGILGGSPIKDLLAAGYNVLTWDPRGFGKSTGQAEVDSPAYEAKDVSTLIGWVASRPGVQLDRAGDPRMGMVGGSYGGGIQFVTAAADCRVDAIVPTIAQGAAHPSNRGQWARWPPNIATCGERWNTPRMRTTAADCRVDAIVPTIAWHSLTTSLDKNATVKSGWSSILTNLSTSSHVDPEVTASYHSGVVDGVTTPAQLAWFAARGPAQQLRHVRIPSLIVQGTVDTLFTLQEGVDNYASLKADGVTTSMRWFCGGHGVCLTPTGNPTATEQATLAWLRRYVQRDTSADTGPGFGFVDQNGTSYSALTYPLPQGVPFTASGSGTLPLVATGGSGPITSTPGGQQLGSLVGPITPAPASNAVNVAVRFTRAGVIVGAPRVVLTYSGTAPAGTRPTRVFAQLVDKTTGAVLGNQVTPIAVTLDGATHTTTVPLEIVAYTAEASSDVELQLVATSVTYEVPRLGGSVHFVAIHLALPVASSLTPVAGPHQDPAPTTAAG
jgi:ABC-2 type transport system ATP-binding protein